MTTHTTSTTHDDERRCVYCGETDYLMEEWDEVRQRRRDVTVCWPCHREAARDEAIASWAERHGYRY